MSCAAAHRVPSRERAKDRRPHAGSSAAISDSDPGSWPAPRRVGDSGGRDHSRRCRGRGARCHRRCRERRQRTMRAVMGAVPAWSAGGTASDSGCLGQEMETAARPGPVTSTVRSKTSSSTINGSSEPARHKSVTFRSAWSVSTDDAALRIFRPGLSERPCTTREANKKRDAAFRGSGGGFVIGEWT